MGAAGTRDLIFHSLCGPVERKKPWIWAAQVRQIYLIFEGRIISSEAAMGGGGARSALFGVAMSWKRRVRVAHGRARAAKTH
jgi:hypothetical protein